MQESSTRQQTNKNTNPIISRQDYHLTQLCPSEENQANKLSTNLTLYNAYTSPWTNLRRAETKWNKEFHLEAWGKETSNTVSLKKIMKRQRNTTQIKEEIRNTEVQINEEEIGKLPENVFRIMIVKWSKTLKTKWRKCKNQLRKT